MCNKSSVLTAPRIYQLSLKISVLISLAELSNSFKNSSISELDLRISRRRKNLTDPMISEFGPWSDN